MSRYAMPLGEQFLRFRGKTLDTLKQIAAARGESAQGALNFLVQNIRRASKPIRGLKMQVSFQKSDFRGRCKDTLLIDSQNRCYIEESSGDCEETGIVIEEKNCPA